jgi:hypothetical protein
MPGFKQTVLGSAAAALLACAPVLPAAAGVHGVGHFPAWGLGRGLFGAVAGLALLPLAIASAALSASEPQAPYQAPPGYGGGAPGYAPPPAYYAAPQTYYAPPPAYYPRAPVYAPVPRAYYAPRPYYSPPGYYAPRAYYAPRPGYYGGGGYYHSGGYAYPRR